MSSSIEYKDYVLGQIETIKNVKCKCMMGEFLLYYNDILFGGIYDNRLLVKIVPQNEKYKMEKQIPYENAKPMFFISEIENKNLVKEIILETCKGLKKQK